MLHTETDELMVRSLVIGKNHQHISYKMGVIPSKGESYDSKNVRESV
jgi:hypothetical protein